ncbi:helix-turn-helix domain-containing protein [Metabacillus fastidiosus]|uniref:helix-turn-helix domain-containing protein n=1 Tax=Metabacillus fastidiosus TaxID=1458 RepID=UPI003D2C6053
MASIGEKIKEARTKKKMTQQELSDLLNVSRSAISNWESGRNYPDLDTIVRLSDILEISLNQLLREDKIMVKEISEEQRKNAKRKIILRIIVPLFIISLFTTSYLLYQENSNVHNIFSPTINKTITLENNTKNGQEFEFNYTKNIFWKKEIVNTVGSTSEIEIRIIDKKTNNVIYNFSIQPGKSHELNSLKGNTDYLIELRGKNGTYLLKFI